jgi:hypothetical protein
MFKGLGYDPLFGSPIHRDALKYARSICPWGRPQIRACWDKKKALWVAIGRTWT